MNVETILKQLKEFLPEENFKVQPDTARQEILNLEKMYNVNTKDFFENPEFAKLIPEEICEKWINTFDTFITFGGSIDELNHLTTYNNDLDEKLYLRKTPAENETIEYIDEKSKESDEGFLAFFLYLDNFIYFHPFFWMKQQSGICSVTIYS